MAMVRYVSSLNLYPRKKRDVNPLACGVSFNNYIKALGQLYKNKEYFHKQYKDLSQLRSDVYYLCKNFNVGLPVRFEDKYASETIIHTYDSVYVPVRLGTKWFLLCMVQSSVFQGPYPKCMLLNLKTLAPIKTLNGNEVVTWKRILGSLARSYHVLHDCRDLDCYHKVLELYTSWAKLVEFRQTLGVPQPTLERYYTPLSDLQRYTCDDDNVPF